MHHIIKQDRKKDGIDQEITPTCSCGWTGIMYAAHNDWQHLNVSEQMVTHSKSISLNESVFIQWGE